MPVLSVTVQPPITKCGEILPKIILKSGKAKWWYGLAGGLVGRIGGVDWQGALAGRIGGAGWHAGLAKRIRQTKVLSEVFIISYYGHIGNNALAHFGDVAACELADGLAGRIGGAAWRGSRLAERFGSQERRG